VNLRFGDFVLSVESRRLLRQGADVHLSPKAFALLKTLVESYPSAVSKAELHGRLWPNIFVSEGNLALLMTEIRNALGDDARDPRYVRTLHGFGYAFKAEVAKAPGTEGDDRSHWLIWETHSFRLVASVNIVGRNPDCDVILDVPGVSRRHASIMVEGRRTVIADLGSKNGTVVRGKRISGGAALNDRDEIEIGPVTLTYRDVFRVKGAETFTMPPKTSASSRPR